MRQPVLFQNGAFYYGEWLKNTTKRQGRGILLTSRGNKYGGYWENDMSNIKGRLKHSNGELYEGEWRDNKSEGRGRFYFSNGSYYEGEFRNDLPHGEGSEISRRGNLA